jgi:magnesium chelatase family protein
VHLHGVAARDGRTTESTDALAAVHGSALRGLEPPAVTLEVHLAHSLPSFTLVGLADAAVNGSRERVRAALPTSGLESRTTSG